MSITVDKAATWIAFRQIVKRTFTAAAAPKRTFPRQVHHHPVRDQIFASTSRSRSPCKQANGFASEGDPRRQDESAWRAVRSPNSKRKATRTSPTSHSLRKVAVDAQRSSSRQTLIRGSGKLRHVDHEAETKDVTAFCAAESYDLFRAKRDMEAEGYLPDPVGTGLFPQVLHVQTSSSNPASDHGDTGQVGEDYGCGDVFIFPSGCVVTWDVPVSLTNQFVEHLLPNSAGPASHLDRKEVEDMEFIEDPSHEISQIVGDTIILGTKASTTPHDSHLTHANAGADDTSTRDTVLAKIAFSSALARSTRLAVLEARLDTYFHSTQHIPSTLSSGKSLPITRSQILRKTGELLHIRAQLNLYSELTDSLPDLFWDSPHSLGLEGYYEHLGKALDVGIRIKILNEKMDYASEIAAVLRERLSEKHGTMLEWMIIGLICIEVGFGVVHLGREQGEMEENDKIRGLAERWLERELRKTE